MEPRDEVSPVPFVHHAESSSWGDSDVLPSPGGQSQLDRAKVPPDSLVWKPMKVALINPARNWMPPTSLMYIGTALRRHGHDVRIFDDLSFHGYEMDAGRLSALVERVEEYDPGLVGIGFMSCEWPKVPPLLNALHRSKVSARIVCGGRHPSCFPREVLAAGADFVCVGEGEGLTVSLVEAIESGKDFAGIEGLAWKHNGRICLCGAPARHVDVNEIPSVDYSLVDYDAYLNCRNFIQGRYYKAGWVLTGRGCPGKCNYCRDGWFSHPVRLRNMDLVLDEIQHQVEQFHVEAIQILDDLFVMNRKRVMAFCGGMRDRGLRIPFAVFARVDSLNEEIAAALKDAGCIQVILGIESGSQRMLDFYCKGVTVEQNLQAMKLLNKYQLPINANVMVNGVNETEEDYRQTVELLAQVELAMVVCSILTPLPGTDLYDQAVSNKWIDPATAKFDAGSRTPDLCVSANGEELYRRVNDLYRRFSKSVFLMTLLRFSLTEKVHFLLHILTCALRQPRRMAVFATHFIRGDFDLAARTFHEMIFHLYFGRTRKR